MQRPSPTDMMKQRDEELDKKIVALRRKNEALMKRYQEVEEDKKKAEQEGMALQSRKTEELSITINKTTNQEPRVVMKKAGSGGGSPQDKSPKGGGEAADGGPNQFSMGRGKRRQLFVTMVGNSKGTRVVSESADPNPQRPGGKKSSAEDDEENRTESSRKGKHSQSRKRTSQTQEDGARQEGQAAAEESRWLTECDPYYQDGEWLEPPPLADLTIPTSREEQLEYMRWKCERDEIDRERVARHQNAKGQWRRAWDLDKPQLVFSDKTPGETERPHSNRGGRAPRRGHSKSAGESQGHGKGRDRKGKNSSAVVGSKAKGKDRLTGRARRWDIKDKDEDKQSLETSLEEFLEELDALCDPDNPSTESEAPQNSDGTAAGAATAAADDNSGTETGLVTLETKQTDASSDDDDTDKRGNAETASPKGTEKKVRFSQELVQGAHVQRNPDVVVVETKGSLLKGASLQVKTDLSEAEPDSTADKPQLSQPQQHQQQQQQQQTQQQQQQQQQTQQQEEETDSRHQEDQDTRHLSPTSTEDCSPAAPAQEAQEEKADNEKEQVKETDKVKETEKEEDKQPDGEAQKPPHSTASETTKAAESVPTEETKGAASTTLDHSPDQQALEQQAPEQQAQEQQAQEQQAPDQQAPEQQAPDQQAPEQQAPDQQAQDQQAQEQQAPDQQAQEQPAPDQQAPEQQAQEQQAPEQQAQEQQAPEQQAQEQTAQTKTSTSRVTEELIDSSLSVLSIDAGDAHPDHVTSTEKAREDGKVV